MKEKKYLIEFDKWKFTGGAGICIAFFFALLSSNPSPELSILLLLSSICFGTALPVFVALLLFVIYYIPTSGRYFRIKKDVLIGQDWSYVKLQFFSFFLLFMAFVFLGFFFSYAIGIALLVGTILACFLLQALFSNSFEESG